MLTFVSHDEARTESLNRMQLSTTIPDLPSRCEFQHKVFSTLGQVSFRRSDTDGIPMMSVRLGEREAQLPLDSLRREFAISKDSADGRMLDLIGSALDYVPSLQPGDRLPPEVCTGEASWRPSADNICLATTRLQLDLLAWITPDAQWAEVGRDEMSLLSVADDPALEEDVRAVSAAAAGHLGLANGGDVTRLLDELATELAYIEALREQLQRRVSALCRRLGRLLQTRKRSAGSFDTLSQVHRLATVAAKQVLERFEEVDAQTGEIGGLLRNAASQRAFIRSNRDWLYRTQRSWEPVLDRWGGTADGAAEDMGALLATTYQFLAQRFLPATQWQRPGQPSRSKHSTARMTW